MSADNWAECPRCGGKSRHAYGKVSEADYRKLLEQPRETLREDYEIGIYDGKFHIGYRGECCDLSGHGFKGCGFKFTFEHEEEVK